MTWNTVLPLALELRQQLDYLKDSLDAMNAALDGAEGVTDDIRLVQRRHHRRALELEEIGERVMTQLALLSELMRTTVLMTSTHDVGEIVEDVLDTVIQITGAERAYLMLYNDNRELELRAARNWDHRTISQAEASLSSSVINTALAAGEPILTADAAEDERFFQQASVLEHRFCSIICVPLTLGDKAAGVLYADNRHQYAVFNEDIVPVLSAFGTQAAIAILNAHLYAELQHQMGSIPRTPSDFEITIDRERVVEQVSEITQSGYFNELAEAARALRRQRKGGGS
jgi:GAF domain-containing protein